MFSIGLSLGFNKSNNYFGYHNNIIKFLVIIL